MDKQAGTGAGRGGAAFQVGGQGGKQFAAVEFVIVQNGLNVFLIYLQQGLRVQLVGTIKKEPEDA